MSENMSESVYLLTLFMGLGTVLLIFGMRHYSAVQQAKARIAHDEDYRQIAAKAVSAQADTALALSSINATLADLKSRLALLERILKEVE